MKVKSDPRHIKRVKLMQFLFSRTFGKNADLDTEPETESILKNLNSIDKLIEKNAPAWPLEQIAPVDLAILRLATWELLYKDKKEPYKAIVDEAVEIAKSYGNDTSASFVNGVLGSIIKEQKLATNK